MKGEIAKSVFDTQVQQNEADAKIVVALERLSETFRFLLWQEGKTHGLTPIQIQVLIFLNYHKSDFCKVSYLAQEFNMTKATISDTIKILFQKGLIIKEIEPNDTRSYTIFLTEKGKKMSLELGTFANVLLQPFQQLTPDKKSILLESLLHTIYQLTQVGIIQTQRMCYRCRFYESNYCNLLKQKLDIQDIRLDCAEFEM